MAKDYNEIIKVLDDVDIEDIALYADAMRCDICGSRLQPGVPITISMTDVDEGDAESGPIPPSYSVICAECENEFLTDEERKRVSRIR